MNIFLKDVLEGLQATPKYLQSKYFYNKKGDELFQKIMNCDDYYLTNCELEIFKNQSSEIASLFSSELIEFDIVELGAGDATKSQYLLKSLLDKKIDFNYFPVDISENVIDILDKDLPNKLPGLRMKGLKGEYFEMLAKAKKLSEKLKIVLFLGSNIGNIKPEETVNFLKSLRKNLSVNDLVLIGFDLKKNPNTILKAYNDSEGYTKAFNLNLLERINEEFGGNFNLSNFEHYPLYDPQTGSAKSFLISLKNQVVEIADKSILFSENEFIDMEISQKYSVDEINNFASQSGFKVKNHFFDSKKWFLDAVWQCV